MSDIAIEFRVKNGRLKRAILNEWPSYAVFAKTNAIPYSVLIGLLGMKRKAHGVDDWYPVSMNIATALHLEPEDLWPNEMARAVLSRNNGEFSLTLEEAARISGPDQIDRKALTHLMHGLRPNEIKAITSFAKGETFDQTGLGLGEGGRDVSRERARQITMKALRKMRSAARNKNIEFADVMGDA